MTAHEIPARQQGKTLVQELQLQAATKPAMDYVVRLFLNTAQPIFEGSEIRQFELREQIGAGKWFFNIPRGASPGTPVSLVGNIFRAAEGAVLEQLARVHGWDFARPKPAADVLDRADAAAVRFFVVNAHADLRADVEARMAFLAEIIAAVRPQ